MVLSAPKSALPLFLAVAGDHDDLTFLFGVGVAVGQIQRCTEERSPKNGRR
jgi:hypothetical protein